MNKNDREVAMPKNKVTYGVSALLLTSILWGSSFPAIKLVVSEVSSYTYTWVRSSLALMVLLPYLVYVYLKKGISWKAVKGGLMAGIAYSLGLWLQGWGTKFTTASNSAFITGLNVIFVHIYVALILREYNSRLALALIFSMTGLYLLTSPSTGFNIGDLLVLVSAVMWAAQIIIVDAYGEGDPLVFTFFEILPALAYSIPDFLDNGFEQITHGTLIILVYLAVFCSVFAFTLQVYGQRYVSPAIASIIFLSEPVFASLFAYVILSEVLSLIQIAGAGMIILAMLISSLSKTSYKQI